MSSSRNTNYCLHCDYKKWPLVKIDFKSSFLQTGLAKRDVYLIPPRESFCSSRMFWLLLVAAYGLVNSNAKWQEHSDLCLTQLGFMQLKYTPQLFYIFDQENLCAVAVKIVDDVLFSGPRNFLEQIISKITSRYTLRTVVFGPGTFLYYGLTISQNEVFSCVIHADDKLNSYEPYPIDRNRRKMQEDDLNELELRNFRSINSSIGWRVISASPLCAFSPFIYSRKVQHRKSVTW